MNCAGTGWRALTMEMAMISKEQIRPEKMLDPKFSLGNQARYCEAGRSWRGGRSCSVGCLNPSAQRHSGSFNCCCKSPCQTHARQGVDPVSQRWRFCLCIFQAWTLGVDSMPCAVCRDPGRWALSSLVIRCAKSIDQSIGNGHLNSYSEVETNQVEKINNRKKGQRRRQKKKEKKRRRKMKEDEGR